MPCAISCIEKTAKQTQLRRRMPPSRPSALYSDESSIVPKATMARELMLCIFVVATFAPVTLHAESCQALSKLASPSVSIVLAQPVDAGTFTPSGGTDKFPGLPSFCRITATIKPTSDSDIGIEVWLPASNWNGRFLAVGSGGWGGSINYDSMAEALRRGYATSATDDGHRTPGASFIVGHPEKFIDFAYRAEHEMTVQAKALI